MKKYYSKKNIKNKEETVANYYDLKQDAVNELTKALKNPDEVIKEEDKKVEQKQHDPYKVDKLSKIPTWIKACFIKFWVAGAICFFFFWGLGYYISSMENLILATSLATGLIIDFLVTPAFLYFESDKKEYHKFIMVPVSCKKLWTLLINIPIAVIQIYGVVTIYAIINEIIVNVKGYESGTITLGVEPLLFGVFFVLIDMLLLLIKNIFVDIIKKAKI